MNKILMGALIVCAIAAIYFGTSYVSLRNSIENAVPETLKVEVIRYLKPDPIVIETTKAYLDLKRIANNKGFHLNEMRRAKNQLDSMYEAAMQKIDSLGVRVPTATLNASVLRDLPDGRKAGDTVHTEYRFPPANDFVNTRVRLGELPMRDTTLYIEREIPIGDSFFDKLKLFGIGVGVGGLLYGVLK